MHVVIKCKKILVHILVHTVLSSRNAQLNQLDLVVVAFTHMLVCAGLQTDPFELLVVFCTRGLKQIGLK